MCEACTEYDLREADKRIVELESEIAHLHEENREYADLVAGLIGMTEKRCTCGYGGFHEEGNPDCDRNEDE